MKTDVLPWLMKETEMYLDELNAADTMRDEMMDTFVNEISSAHQATIADHNKKRDDAIKQAEEEEKARIEAKAERRRQREASKRADELARLKDMIDEEFVKKGKTEEGIIFQDVVDIDGFGRKQQPIVSVIGGFIGQLAMVLNTIAKHYQRLDVPIKSRASSRKQETPSRPQTESSQKELKPEESKASLPPQEDPHQILAPKIIQRFIYDYINEKLKTEKLSVQVDPEFENFLRTKLRVPLELNQMRTMKEPQSTDLRELIR